MRGKSAHKWWAKKKNHFTTLLIHYFTFFMCLAWVNIKNEAAIIKYSASLWWKNEKPSQISRRCVSVNYAEERLLNYVSVTDEWTFSPEGFQGQDNIFFIENKAIACPIKTSAYIESLQIDYEVRRWSVWLRVCRNELYRSLREHNLQRYMHLAASVFMLIR